MSSALNVACWRSESGSVVAMNGNIVAPSPSVATVLVVERVRQTKRMAQLVYSQHSSDLPNGQQCRTVPGQLVKRSPLLTLVLN